MSRRLRRLCAVLFLSGALSGCASAPHADMMALCRDARAAHAMALTYLDTAEVAGDAKKLAYWRAWAEGARVGIIAYCGSSEIQTKDEVREMLEAQGFVVRDK